MPDSKDRNGAIEQSIRVEIYNQTYSIRSDGDNDYILSLAEYVDSKMREISSGTLTVDSLKVAASGLRRGLLARLGGTNRFIIGVCQVKFIMI